MYFESFMSAGGWTLFSVASSVFSAVFYLTNQYYRQPGHVLIFWSRVMIVLLMTPLMAHIDWPREPVFYLAVALTALLGVSADVRTANAVIRYGGGVVSRMQPLSVWLSFLLWFAFDPGIFRAYLAHPFNTAGILAALGGCIFFAAQMRRCHISRAAFLYVLPTLFAYAATAGLNKFAMNHGALNGAVFGYMYVQSVIAVPMMGGYVAWKERRAPAPFWRTRDMLLAALLMTLAWLFHMVYKNYAMAFTPNPSYQGALNLITPVFIAFFYKWKKHKEEADVRSGMGIVACAVLLALLTVQ